MHHGNYRAGTETGLPAMPDKAKGEPCFDLQPSPSIPIYAHKMDHF
jgi:hypothetical protein